MKKTIYCKHCCGEIESKADLVVTTHFFEVAPYHEQCYSKELKTMNSMFLDKPINSTFATYTMLIFSPLIFIAALFMSNPYKFILLASIVLGLGVRAYSWMTYERYLE